VAAVAGALAIASPAGATSATATLTGGSLGLVNVPNVTLSDTLNGLNQTATTTQAIDVGDATGSGTGWNLTGTSTTFATSGNAHSLSTAATQIASAPAVACDASVTCTAAVPTVAVSYPYALPAAGTAPLATKLFNAGGGTGMGDQTVTPTWSVAIPANAYAAQYQSTWTISLVSAP
jgi:hypothetical protein